MFTSLCKNLQVQCVVATEIVLVYYVTQRGRIRTETNASFADAIYDIMKLH